jgi:hypothetical protein
LWSQSHAAAEVSWTWGCWFGFCCLSADDSTADMGRLLTQNIVEPVASCGGGELNMWLLFTKYKYNYKDKYKDKQFLNL